ncbi:MAG TPA: MFS transporter [Jatrophihabitans sp.]|nr:MFS transporter [Jatrophihabitans sp.]
MPRTLARRLVPLQVAVGLQGFILWVPVEKLFMTQIGFTARTVGIMAAAYAAVVPLLEVPSGILADRWSRNQIMVCATVALLASSLLGGLSRNVPTYIAAAMILGVYFALESGTVDSIVYDTVLEETGSSDQYEMWIGRIRMVESGALVISALAGGVLAGWTSARLTYFATLPLVAVAIVAFLRFDEPRLHRAAEPVAWRAHVALTYRTMIGQPAIRQVVLLAALVALLSQAVFEFGPLWLVALAASAALFGPYWAALVSTLGVGGYLTSKLNLDNPLVLGVLALGTPASAFILTQTHTLAGAIAAQVVLALLLAIIAIQAGKLLHDGVPSNVRAGVSSGVGTLSWLLFLPFSLVFGWFARAHGVQNAGWFLTAAALLVGFLLIAPVLRRRPKPVPVSAAHPDEFACQELVELVTDYLDGALPPELREQLQTHLTLCDGCAEYLHQIGLTIDALKQAGLRLVSGPRSGDRH